MSKLVFFILFIGKFLAQEVKFDPKLNYSLKPIWEDDKHFCYYKGLYIESSLSNLEEIINNLINNPEEIEFYGEKLREQVNNLRIIICPIERK